MDYGLGKTNTCGPNRLPRGLAALKQNSSAGVPIGAGGKSSWGYGAEEEMKTWSTSSSYTDTSKLLVSLLGEELEIIGNI